MNRIREMRRGQGISQAELAKRVGVHQTAISQWENGRTGPDRKSLAKLAQALNVSFDDLLGTQSVCCRVPILGEIHAGLPVEAVQDVLGYEEITPETARRGSHFALRVVGESMLPRFCPGDVVIVRQQSDAESGEIVVALVSDSDATVKKLIKKENGIVLMPLNPAFEPMVYTVQEIASLPVTVLGKVVELRARF